VEWGGIGDERAILECCRGNRGTPRAAVGDATALHSGIVGERAADDRRDAEVDQAPPGGAEGEDGGGPVVADRDASEREVPLIEKAGSGAGGSPSGDAQTRDGRRDALVDLENPRGPIAVDGEPVRPGSDDRDRLGPL